MASITLFADGTVEARYAKVAVYLDVQTFADEAKTILHSSDTLGIHGSHAQLRAFFQAGLAALPPEHPPEPEPDPPYPDIRDAGELFAKGRRLVEAPGSDLLHG